MKKLQRAYLPAPSLLYNNVTVIGLSGADGQPAGRARAGCTARNVRGDTARVRSRLAQCSRINAVAMYFCLKKIYPTVQSYKGQYHASWTLLTNARLIAIACTNALQASPHSLSCFCTKEKCVNAARGITGSSRSDKAYRQSDRTNGYITTSIMASQKPAAMMMMTYQPKTLLISELVIFLYTYTPLFM